MANEPTDSLKARASHRRSRSTTSRQAAPEIVGALSPDETRVLVHELRVHQIELELQNDELRKTQAALDLARAEYFDLYDLAPVGYCTLSSEGLIVRANLKVATMLGSTRAFLTSQPFNRFILPEDQDLFYLHRKRLIESAEPFACDLRMAASGGAPFWAHVSAMTAPGPDGLPLLRLVIDDITVSKRAEIALRESVLEKESLLKEVHHRVRKNLQVISGLLNLEVSRSTEASTQEALKAMQGRILSMALLQETLQWTGKLGGIELAAYLRVLATRILQGQSATPDVRLTLDLAPILMAIDQAVPCGLIVNEVLTSILKHAIAFGRAGEIKIALHQADGRVRLAVTDTGLGLPEDLDLGKGNSPGLRLVSDLAHQLGGALVVGPAPDPVFTVIFPLTPPPEPPAPPLGS